jgi:hypothetical protein
MISDLAQIFATYQLLRKKPGASFARASEDSLKALQRVRPVIRSLKGVRV